MAISVLCVTGRVTIMAPETQWACHGKVLYTYFNEVIERHTHRFREFLITDMPVGLSTMKEPVCISRTTSPTKLPWSRPWSKLSKSEWYTIARSLSRLCSSHPSLQNPSPAILSHSEFSSLTKLGPSLHKMTAAVHLPYCLPACSLRKASALPEKPTAQFLLKPGSPIDSARANSKNRYTTPVSTENVTMM